MITYAEFLQQATVRDLTILTLIAHKQVIRTDNLGDAEAYMADLTRLFNAGLISQGRRAYERINGTVYQSFDAILEPAAVTYMAQLAVDGLAAIKAAAGP